MTDKPADTPQRSFVPTLSGAAPVSVGATPRTETRPEHPHQNLDRARAAMARLSGGVSAHAFIEAWTDWAFHFGHLPGRQLELAERAQQNASSMPF